MTLKDDFSVTQFAKVFGNQALNSSTSEGDGEKMHGVQTFSYQSELVCSTTSEDHGPQCIAKQDATSLFKISRTSNKLKGIDSLPLPTNALKRSTKDLHDSF